MTELEQLEQAIALQEKLRGLVPDDVIDAAIAALQEKLAGLAPSTRDEQRKLVTVLFADLTSWTALSERLDAEDVREIQRMFFAAVTHQILQRGGRVEKYIGDAVLAVFGVPQATEGDPENAIRAALAIQQSMAALNEQLAGSSGVPQQNTPISLPGGPLASDLLPLSVRVGVHTGLVLATIGQGTDNFMVTGDTVNQAARLQSAAPPGGVLISHDTWRHVEDLFEVEALAPLTLKGKTEPVRSYLVLQARPRTFRKNVRGVAGVETRMVGREEELKALQDTLEGIRNDRQAQMVMVVGEAGVGKSRLLVEFESWVESLPDHIFRFKGRAAPEAQQTPYGLLRDVFAARFEIEEGDRLDDVRHKLVEGFTSPLSATDGTDAVLTLKEAHLLGQLFGYDFSESPHVVPLRDTPQQLRTQALAALDTYYGGLSRHHPAVVILEDLHWADDSSLDAISRLLLNLQDYPVLILGAARSSLYRRRSHWGADLTNSRRLDLQPLGHQAVDQLLQEILQKAGEVPSGLREMVLDNADGNPFFVEELVKMLIEDGIILTSDKEADDWRIEVEHLPEVQVPPGLTALLQARVDRLTTDQRTALQQASVVGRLFWDRAIAHIRQFSKEDVQGVDNALSGLQSREMVFQREFASFPETTEYVFKHALLRDVAYETVLKRLRHVYHGLVADWLIEQTGERSAEYSGLIADHLERAGRRDEAITYFVQAGDQARKVDAHEEAVNRYERALALLEAKSAHEEAARVAMKLGLTHQNAFAHKQARQAFDQAFVFWQKAEEEFRTIELPAAPHPLRTVWSEPRTLDPSMSDEWIDSRVAECLFSGLVRSSKDFEIEPDVAKGWQVSEDGRVYTFILRDDALWSDGVAVTAGDFEFALKKRIETSSDSPNRTLLLDIKNARAYHQGELVDPEQLGVSALDERTLIIELEQPIGYFLQLMAVTGAFPMPRHVVTVHGERWSDPQTIVTNGPFLLRSWHRGEKLVMMRNPRFQGRCYGNVTEVEVFFKLDWPDQVAMYEANKLDYLNVWGVNFNLYAGTLLDPAQLRQRHPDEFVLVPEPTTGYFAIHPGKPPFDDLRVRRALVMATDREKIAESIPWGTVVPATGGFVPPNVPGHSPGISLPYDPVSARQLLAEAGYPGGRGIPPIIGLGANQAAEEWGHIIERWRDILGIEVEVKGLDLPDFYKAIRSTPPALAVSLGWYADYPDPDDFLRSAIEPFRRWWQDEIYEEMVRRAKEMTNPRERMNLYRQADKRLIDEAVIVPLSYVLEPILLKPWLSVFQNGQLAHVKDFVIRPH